MNAVPERIRLEMTPEVLYRLLASGALCAADFRCLDCESKTCVWRLCLMSCKEEVGLGGCRNCGGCPNGKKARSTSQEVRIDQIKSVKKEKQHAER